MDILNTHNCETFRAQAESYFQEDNYQAVIKLASERLASNPHDVDATIFLCHAWIKSGHLKKAMAVLAEVEEKITRLAEIYLSLGDICSKARLLEEAIRYYKRFLAINPHSPKAAQVREFITATTGFTEPTEFQEEQTDEELAPEFYTLTMADLYIQQGHLEMAERVLGVFLTRASEREAALQRLHNIEDIRRARMVAHLSKQNIGHVMDTLGRWLSNASRMKENALIKSGKSLEFGPAS